ncbi:MAG: ATP-binding protein, partial [Candidatus Omnitrophica bacterium]|nr:ATP-binding protein [Candidatus Omnitrophota bacterium]
MTTTQLDTTLRQLRLTGLGLSLPVRLQEAAANRLGHGEFLELILQDELNVRQQRHLEKRKRLAQFRTLKTLEDFDWRFNPQIPKKEIFEPAAGQFIAAASDALFLGAPGLGKTHLAQSIGYEAIKQGRLVRYVSIFDLIGDFLQEEALHEKERALRQYL